MGRVQSKVAIVTGGAVGLGQACSELLAMEGASVLLTDVNRIEGERTAQAIQSRGGNAQFLQHDVSQEDDWRRVIQACKDRFGRIDILVNNAGVGKGCPPDEQTLEEWR